jgi:hypothetical protein
MGLGLGHRRRCLGIRWHQLFPQKCKLPFGRQIGGLSVTTRVRNSWFALFELTNHNTRMCNLIHCTHIRIVIGQSKQCAPTITSLYFCPVAKSWAFPGAVLDIATASGGFFSLFFFVWTIDSMLTTIVFYSHWEGGKKFFIGELSINFIAASNCTTCLWNQIGDEEYAYMKGVLNLKIVKIWGRNLWVTCATPITN